MPVVMATLPLSAGDRRRDSAFASTSKSRATAATRPSPRQNFLLPHMSPSQHTHVAHFLTRRLSRVHSKTSHDNAFSQVSRNDSTPVPYPHSQPPQRSEVPDPRPCPHGTNDHHSQKDARSLRLPSELGDDTLMHAHLVAPARPTRTGLLAAVINPDIRVNEDSRHACSRLGVQPSA